MHANLYINATCKLNINQNNIPFLQTTGGGMID